MLPMLAAPADTPLDLSLFDCPAFEPLQRATFRTTFHIWHFSTTSLTFGLDPEAQPVCCVSVEFSQP